MKTPEILSQNVSTVLDCGETGFVLTFPMEMQAPADLWFAGDITLGELKTTIQKLAESGADLIINPQIYQILDKVQAVCFSGTPI